MDFIDESGAFNPVTPYGESKVKSELAIAELADDSFCPTFLAQRDRLWRQSPHPF